MDEAQRAASMAALGAEPLPEAAVVMLITRKVNNFLGTSYPVEEIITWDPFLLVVLDGLEAGMAMCRATARGGGTLAPRQLKGMI